MAVVGCADVARVACVNWDKVYAALLSEHAPFDEVAVILNTSVYAGSGSNAGVVVSRNVYAPAIALHEMGHSMAGLADEYVDDVVAERIRAGLPRRAIPQRDHLHRSRPDSLETLVHRFRAHSRRPGRQGRRPIRGRVLFGKRVLPSEAGQHHEDPWMARSAK